MTACEARAGAAVVEGAATGGPAAEDRGSTLSLALISTIMAALAVGAEPVQATRPDGVVNGVHNAHALECWKQHLARDQRCWLKVYCITAADVPQCDQG